MCIPVPSKDRIHTKRNTQELERHNEKGFFPFSFFFLLLCQKEGSDVIITDEASALSSSLGHQKSINQCP